MNPSLVFHTLQHLQARQMAGQLRHRIGWLMPSGGTADAGEAGAWPGLRRGDRRCEAVPPASSPASVATAIRSGRMTFLNQERETGWPPQWDLAAPKLWRYNLHYFDWIWSLPPAEAERAERAARDWIERNPRSRTDDGWAPYPVSLRILNWCGFFFGREREATLADAGLRDRLHASLHAQAEWLTRNVEYRLCGNHLLENGAALATAGGMFSGRAADRWLAAGLMILKREIPEQIPGDGMHFERSPMYHLRILHLCENLARLGISELDALVAPRLPKMRTALARMTHPDGEIALLNDSAFGIYHRPGELAEAAGWAWPEEPAGAWSLPDAGYYGWRDEAGNYLSCDAGAIGPDYIPGHAHADIFSFELSLGGTRVIVDAGVHDYEAGELRRYGRSTRAHNTVEVAGQDQCEMWGAFRVARRGRPRDVQWTPAAEGFRLSGWHDGYERLPERARHERTFAWDRASGLTIRDRVTSRRSVRAALRLHFHPACRFASIAAGEARVSHPGGAVRILFPREAALLQEESFYCPEWNVKQGNPVLALGFEGTDIQSEVRIVPETGGLTGSI